MRGSFVKSKRAFWASSSCCLHCPESQPLGLSLQGHTLNNGSLLTQEWLTLWSAIRNHHCGYHCVHPMTSNSAGLLVNFLLQWFCHSDGQHPHPVCKDPLGRVTQCLLWSCGPICAYSCPQAKLGSWPSTDQAETLKAITGDSPFGIISTCYCPLMGCLASKTSTESTQDQ